MEDHARNLTLSRRIAWVAGLLVVSIAFDQWTKRIAQTSIRPLGLRMYLGDLFRLQYSENRGAFLSLGADLPDSIRYGLLTVGVAVMLVALLVYSLVGRSLTLPHVAGYALIVGGGASNWIDRALRGGTVVDFMNLGIGPVRTGIFNVADLAVVGGLVLILLTPTRRSSPPAPADSATP